MGAQATIERPEVADDEFGVLPAASQPVAGCGLVRVDEDDATVGHLCHQRAGHTRVPHRCWCGLEWPEHYGRGRS